MNLARSLFQFEGKFYDSGIGNLFQGERAKLRTKDFYQQPIIPGRALRCSEFEITVCPLIKGKTFDFAFVEVYPLFILSQDTFLLASSGSQVCSSREASKFLFPVAEAYVKAPCPFSRCGLVFARP